MNERTKRGTKNDNPGRWELPRTFEERLALLMRPIPVGSGIEEHGTGRVVYVRQNRLDGSARVLYLDSVEEHQRLFRAAISIEAEAELGVKLPLDEEGFWKAVREAGIPAGLGAPPDFDPRTVS